MLRHRCTEENADFFRKFVQPAINACTNKNEFPSFLKHADVIPVFKKDSKRLRPISILRKIFKVNERVRFKQIVDLLETFFRNFNVAFRKHYDT